MDLERLIDQIREGDPASGPVLVSFLAPRLASYLSKSAAYLSEEDRTQIAERTVEQAVRNIDKYDPDRATFFAWVRGIARHAVQQWHRDHPGLQSRPLFGFERAEDEELQPSAATPQLVAALNELIDTEPEATQLLLRLRFTEGLPHEAIASALGVSSAATRKRLERAMKRLRERAADHPDLRHLGGDS